MKVVNTNGCVIYIDEFESLLYSDILMHTIVNLYL